jgi:quercetin dioxygenase-like cupin family protein
MSQARITRPEEHARYRTPVGGEMAVRADGAGTGGRMAVLDTAVAPGEGPPRHVHRREDEGLLILEGRFQIALEDELTEAGPGAFVFLPRDTPHTWRNVGDDQGRLLVILTPAGLEGFFERVASEPEPDKGAFARFGAEFGMEVVGPPLADLPG